MKRRKNSRGILQGYDYSTAEAREETVAALFSRARNARGAAEREWERCNDYYNGIHDITRELREWCGENELGFVPPCVPDAWVLVESQIDPTVPQPEFHGRDSDLDSRRARQREYAVRYIAENNRLVDLNTRNERRLLKYGDAFWKAYWDAELSCGETKGDVRIRDLPLDSIFPDPAVRGGDLQDGQFVDYVYRLHKVRFAQIFREDLEALGLDAEEISGTDYLGREGLFDLTSSLDEDDDTIQVLEHWFRQPIDIEEGGETIRAGSVACSIQAGGRELRYIPNYWRRTGRQNTLFPFVHYWRIQDENSFYNKSELFPVLELIDAADRKLAMGVLGDAFTANDIILVEEGALADGAELTNEPGAVVRCRPNRINGVRRLGGLQSLANAAVGLEWYKEQIERGSRNYELTRGAEALHTDTASGLAMLRSDAEGQENIKRADRNRGFERLYELLDWLALEFYDDKRMIWLGADEKSGREAVCFRFHADALRDRGIGGAEDEFYWPRIDVTVSAGDNLLRSRRAVAETLSRIASTPITAENWRVLAAELELLDLPGREEIVESWRNRFLTPGIPA